MSVLERRTRVLEFVERWKGRGNEKQETQRFWIDLLQNVLDVERPTEAALFEYRTVGGGFIDVLCPEARLLVEQKSAGIDMDKPEARQGTPVTPVQQALRYADALPLSKKPAVLSTCNFETFRFYDLEQDPRATGTPVDEFALEDLGEHLGTLESIFSSEHSRVMVEQKLSEHAGLLVANLHNTLAAQYDDPDDPESHHSLAVLTVRLVFCLYAEDAGLYPGNSFSQYVESYDAAHLRRAIIDLFNVLNTPFDQRDKYLEDDLKRFPYVNGGLFAEGIEIPQFTDLIRESLLAAGNGVRLAHHQPRHLRLADGGDPQPRPAPQGRHALHLRQEHPQGHRPALPRQSHGRARPCRTRPDAWREGTRGPAQSGTGQARLAGRPRSGRGVWSTKPSRRP